MRLPPLSALPAFEATARLGSVSAAAEELGRTHSAISKQLKSLSADLGGDLFQRKGTGLQLTARGIRLQTLLEPMLQDLANLRQALRLDVSRPRVKLAISATLATRWLTPRLADFYARHPEIQVDLMMSGPHRDMNEPFDMMLSYDRLRGPFIGAGPGVMMERIALAEATYAPVCAPDYPFERMDNGLKVALRLTHAGAPNLWQAWEKLTGQPVSADHQQEHPHHILALEAAAAGMGVSISEFRVAETDLIQGRLIAPLGFFPMKDGFQAGVMPDSLSKPPVQALLNWLRDQANLPRPPVPSLTGLNSLPDPA
ncbi:Gcv operon activator [Tritonibacter multivorans]|uniref:Gcv operon activator n=1 Tax=Tritonibacter multivorans TaxID=928856 RepID=A0A0P1GGS9_9RHOB|nr:LysR substrate-binding domain-containing protein [Tritonibacter multivorans]MDA7420705.1 LysR substrate-binding domain-containing protein [Tritonibacter multivorans]CUH81092.1 Gcv operon activator [Tritonibacter multivorans]SFC28059.1 DNA-binding transcriptional regulator, LysR family [Tritonibacter multivorans]